MAIRIEWDEFEIALLIEACEEVLRKGKPKSEVVKTVSSNLRKRAISKNIAIDDVFRNENGIALQMQKMAYLLTHGEKGMPGASKLYAEVAELREENPKKFEEILKRAKEEIEMTDLSQQNIDKKALFAQWLNEHPIKKYTPSAIIDALDVASRYCVSKKVCKDGFWSMQNKAEFNAATSKLLSFRLFRLKYRSAAAKMDKAIPLYKAFLDSYVASREENTAEFEGEALNEPDSMLSTAAANSDDIIRLDFSDIGSLIFSKPVCLNYKDHTFTDFNSWASLYAKVAFLLKQDYPQIIVDGGSLSEGAAPEFTNVTGFLKLHGELATKRALKTLATSGISGHVVVLTYQCKNYLKFSDPRIVESGRVVIVDGASDTTPGICLVNPSISAAFAGCYSGLQKIGAIVENCPQNTAYISTMALKDSFPESIYHISQLNNGYDILVRNDPKSNELIKKLTSLAGSHKARELKRNVIVDGRGKIENKQILYIIDAINDAINQRKKISFQKIEYNIKKERVLHHGGERYTFSPYSLVWDGDNYYVVGYSDKYQTIGSHRVDRIAACPYILDESAVPQPVGFDVSKYIKTTFRMYNAPRAEVELLCDNSVMDAIIDRFGPDVQTYAGDLQNFRVIEEIAVGKVFFNWIFGFEGKVRIKGPESVKKQYREMVMSAMNLV